MIFTRKPTGESRQTYGEGLFSGTRLRPSDYAAAGEGDVCLIRRGSDSAIRRKVKSLHHGATEDHGEKLELGFNHRDTENTEKTHCLSLLVTPAV